MNSLDPRVARLPEIGTPGHLEQKDVLDQLGTFQVFVRPKEGKPFQHEGIVHAPDLELAFILAKETFTRRFTCVSLAVGETKNVFVSPMAEGETSAYDLVGVEPPSDRPKQSFEIFHLPKRGKQHVHVGSVEAADPAEAFAVARQKFASVKSVQNVWAIRTSDILFTSAEEEKELWLTLPEKKFRDAAAYKGGEKLSNFLASRKSEPQRP
jgi:ring-1,2-phenylacetyl-CoA epoxidase subunit PaaB